MRFARIISLLLICSVFCIFIFSSCETEVTGLNTKDTAAQLVSSVDYDLSALTQSEAYQQCAVIMNNFKDYAGKTVRLNGQYQFQNYHFIIVADVTQCCSAYFEFLYNGEYPAVNSDIQITGTFGYYMEGEQSYPYINVSKLTVKSA